MTRVPFSIFRVQLIAGQTLREAAGQRLFGAIGLLAVALVAGVPWVRELNFGSSELKFIADFGLGALAFFGAALAIVATAQLFFNEIDQRTALTLLAKPVWRGEFLLGKFLGVAALTGVFCGVMTVLLAAILGARETSLMRQFPDAFAHGRAVDYAALGAAGFAQWLKLAVLSALTLLVATFARTGGFATLAGFLVLVVCQLQGFAQEAAARGGSAAARAFAGTVALLFPNFQLYDLSESVAAGSGLSWPALADLSIYSAGYVTAVTALAAFSFRQREI